MPTTITQGFQKLKENLEITDLQEQTVSTRQQNVRDALENEMTVLSSFLTGSYKRNTMVRPLKEADVDIMFVLDSSYYSADGQGSLLDKVKKALKKTYSTPDVSRNGQAVTITFSDFEVDVVPAFNAQLGGYLIADSIKKQWIRTDPKKHVELWSKRNSDKDGKFIPLIKMLKGWNKSHSRTLRSFHLETLAYDIFQNVTISDYPSGARYFFDKAYGKIGLGPYDPAGTGGDVGSYLDSETKKSDVKTRLMAAYTKAKEAEAFAAEGKNEAAYGKWRVIFGDYFPAYG